MDWLAVAASFYRRVWHWGNAIMGYLTKFLLGWLLISSTVAMGAADSTDSTGQWLVDLGRDYPLSPQASLTDADARIALLFMQAATRVEPQRAEGYYWQFDLLNALGEAGPATAALREFLQRDSGHVVGWRDWIALNVSSLQQSEQRAEFSRQQLQNPTMAPLVQAVLHAQLANYQWNRGNFAEAEAEVVTALQLDPDNADAMAVRNLLQPSKSPQTILMESLLNQLRVQPGNVDLTLALADDLIQFGLADEANSWYAHAEELLALAHPEVPRGQLQKDIQTHRSQAATQPAGTPTLDEKARAGIVEALRQFPMGVLDYPLHPRKYLLLSISMSQAEYQPAKNWWCTLRLKNIGTFPITLGQDKMVLPEVVLAFDIQGDQSRHIGPLVRISLNRLPRLGVGEEIEVQQNVKIGPVRSTMIGTPQVTQNVSMTAVLSPARVLGADGQEFVVPAVGGWAAEPVQFKRVAIKADVQQVRGIAARCHGGEIVQRTEAVQLAAMLLAEKQHLTAGRLKYTAEPVDRDVLVAALASAAMDPDWPVRAQVAECLRWMLLDEPTRQAAARLVNDPHWLVRGLAMRMMADQQGQAFLMVLQNSAKADPDEWVRQMCAALAARLTPATQPAAATTESATN